MNDDGIGDLVGYSARIHGVQSKPELNGLIVHVLSYDIAKARYAVCGENLQDPILIQPTSLCRVPNVPNLLDLIGKRVIIKGLQSKSEWNGKLGVVQSYSIDNGRYAVVIDGVDQPKLLQPGNIANTAQAPASREPSQKASSVPNVEKENLQKRLKRTLSCTSTDLVSKSSASPGLVEAIEKMRERSKQNRCGDIADGAQAPVSGNPSPKAFSDPTVEKENVQNRPTHTPSGTTLDVVSRESASPGLVEAIKKLRERSKQPRCNIARCQDEQCTMPTSVHASNMCTICSKCAGLVQPEQDMLDVPEFIRLDEKRMTTLRFQKGDRVYCLWEADEDQPRVWRLGTVVRLFWVGKNIPDRMCAPYQVRLDELDKLIFAPIDNDYCIRSAVMIENCVSQFVKKMETTELLSEAGTEFTIMSKSTMDGDNICKKLMIDPKSPHLYYVRDVHVSVTQERIYTVMRGDGFCERIPARGLNHMFVALPYLEQEKKELDSADKASSFSSSEAEDDIRNALAENSCSICLRSEADVGHNFRFVFAGCGHKCICKPCSRKMRAKGKQSVLECPLCRMRSKLVLEESYSGQAPIRASGHDIARPPCRIKRTVAVPSLPAMMTDDVMRRILSVGKGC